MFVKNKIGKMILNKKHHLFHEKTFQHSLKKIEMFSKISEYDRYVFSRMPKCFFMI